MVRTTSPFLERLAAGPLLCDGAMGTELYARGISYDRCFEQLNLTNPELIKSIHLEYISAGAQIIETNTFGANRYRLIEHGLEHTVSKINRAGAKIAREVRDLSETPIFLAGNIGPLGHPLSPLGGISAQEAREAFLEQAEALLQTGVDLFLLETFSDLTEMQEALSVIRNLTDLPIVALMTFGEDGTVASGEDAQLVAQQLRASGADVVGANCALGPASMFDVVVTMSGSQIEPLTIAVQPNAGLPKRVGNRFMYGATPDYFAASAQRFLESGVRLIGGCCGTTAQHIAAMKKVLVEYAPELPHQEATMIEHVRERVRVRETSDETAAHLPPTQLARLLQQRKFVISVEMSPPRSVKFTRFLQNARTIQESGADFINITDNAMARVRMNNIAAARLIQQHIGIETIVHFTPRDRNLMALQSDVIGAHATDIRNMLIITGDPPMHGDFPNATGIWDVDSIGLIAILNKLNQGLDARGRKLAVKSAFCIGCAANPTATDIEIDIERLQQKIEQGAQYIMTQPVFDTDTLLAYIERYNQRYGKLPIPLLAGIQPLHSYQQAEKFHQEVPGLVIPDGIRTRLREAGEAGSQLGIALAREMIDAIAPLVQGVYLMPIDRFELASELVAYIRERVLMQQSAQDGEPDRIEIDAAQ
ncbi:bifunctional homocysteine S-methyltransferase/methylenetetrahydrofolate reductase [Tengunoibacter tsumagoiensis]|uniref:Bifunctional homocysteine S-methyltransferase/methylenetetrahydrofolate reductase n=1 Tax=Tengunoibacter tsumagoiensis TaxID=2014871 RepID=A0A402AAE6_9CHLR|nr:bifunctional homocysteine S-methyltransferase/methylenetetrahydrofolate reductase [Tengunoibacter tsumagoiensis]GCE15925.1 bifunctional homocysteine S-methyltransferase/methylenetetrahydrofolate reductase [Tengunoibacter tsumagoiensis]